MKAKQFNPNAEVEVGAGSARGPRASLGGPPKLSEHILCPHSGDRNCAGRGFRRAAENGTPAACAPRISGLRPVPISEFGFKAVLAGWLVLAAAAGTMWAAETEGLALAIVYDTSGSMKEPVAATGGRMSPKYLIANRALEGITRQLQAFITNTTAGPRQVSAALIVFTGEGAREAVPFGPFDAPAFLSWGRSFKQPDGGTPLGRALTKASDVVLASSLPRKHVLVITDGMNTIGPDPASVLPGIRQKAAQKGAAVSVHFVAFDVDAKEFAGVKKLGATVVSAANESQLNIQLQFILQKKILLEDEEPPTKSK